MARDFGVGGVGEKRKHSLFAVCGEAMHVDGLPDHRGLIELEVAGVNDPTVGRIDGKGHAVRQAVGDPNELILKGPSVWVSPGATVLSSVLPASLCSSKRCRHIPSVRRLP